MSDAKKFIENQAELEASKVLPHFTDYLKSLMDKREALGKELRAVNDQINMMQSTCPHSWQHEASTPHYEMHRCKHCFLSVNI